MSHFVWATLSGMPSVMCHSAIHGFVVVFLLLLGLARFPRPKPINRGAPMSKRIRMTLSFAKLKMISQLGLSCYWDISTPVDDVGFANLRA